MPTASVLPISPAELLRDFLRTNVNPEILDPDNIVIGPATEDQIKDGCVELVNAGMPKEEPPLLVWIRAQIRSVAPTLYRADVIGQHVREVAHYKNRITARDHLGRQYLIHSVKVVAGPSHHWDSAVTWETLQFAEMMVGTQALDNP